MEQAKYTASLYYNEQLLDSQSGDDFRRLMAKLLNQMDISCTSTYGTIRDNRHGKVIHRCRKTTIE